MIPGARSCGPRRPPPPRRSNPLNVEKIGLAGIVLKAGRLKTEDIINPTAGIEFHVKIGGAVKAGDVIYTIHGDEVELFEKAAEMLEGSYQISLQKPPPHVLIEDILE